MNPISNINQQASNPLIPSQDQQTPPKISIPSPWLPVSVHAQPQQRVQLNGMNSINSVNAISNRIYLNNSNHLDNNNNRLPLHAAPQSHHGQIQFTTTVNQWYNTCLAIASQLAQINQQILQNTNLQDVNNDLTQLAISITKLLNQHKQLTHQNQWSGFSTPQTTARIAEGYCMIKSYQIHLKQLYVFQDLICISDALKTQPSHDQIITLLKRNFTALNTLKTTCTQLRHGWPNMQKLITSYPPAYTQAYNANTQITHFAKDCLVGLVDYKKNVDDHLLQSFHFQIQKKCFHEADPLYDFLTKWQSFTQEFNEYRSLLTEKLNYFKNVLPLNTLQYIPKICQTQDDQLGILYLEFHKSLLQMLSDHLINQKPVESLAIEYCIIYLLRYLEVIKTLIDQSKNRYILAIDRNEMHLSLSKCKNLILQCQYNLLIQSDPNPPATRLLATLKNPIEDLEKTHDQAQATWLSLPNASFG